MTIKWYNRDSISDVQMKQARLVAERLLGKKKENPDVISVEQLQKAYEKATFSSLLPNHIMVSPSRLIELRKMIENKEET